MYPRIEQRVRAFFGKNFNESVRHDCPKLRKSWYKPQPSEVRIHGNDEPFEVLISAQLHNRLLNMGKTEGNGVEQYLAIVGQNDASVTPIEQTALQLSLQFLYVPSHRRMSDVKFVAGFFYALVPRGGLERS
jgi:hypothetical protein